MPSDHNIFSNENTPKANAAASADEPDVQEPSEAELSFRGKTPADLTEGLDVPREFEIDYAMLLNDVQAARGLRGGREEPTFDQVRASYVDTHAMLRTAILELSGELPVDPEEPADSEPEAEQGPESQPEPES